MKSTKFAHEPAPPCLFMVIPWLFGSCSFIGSLTQQQERRADMSMLGCSSPETICCTHIIKYDQHIEAYCWVKLGWVCVLIFFGDRRIYKRGRIEVLWLWLSKIDQGYTVLYIYIWYMELLKKIHVSQGIQDWPCFFQIFGNPHPQLDHWGW